MKMTHIDYIREFVTLADSMSFSKASEDLFISQPSLSRHISVLEAELGVRLLERSTRNVALTCAGTELYADFLRLLDAERAVTEHARALSSGFSGQVRVCSPFYWDAAFIEPMILVFNQRYPNVQVELNICDPIEGMKLLLQGKADVCTGFPLQARPEVEYRKLADERLCAVLPAEHPLAGRPILSLRELAGERFALLDLDVGRPRHEAAMYQLLVRHGVNPAQFIYVKNLETLGITMRQTGAVCLMMQSMGNLHRDYLVSVPLTDEDCFLPLYLFRRADGATDAAVAFFDTVPDM
jgi:DNA-binding transcriptional LysR family regulator